MLKILQARLQQYVNCELLDVLEKAEEPEIKLSTSAGLSKKQESSRKTSIYALLTTLKPLCSVQWRPCGLQHARPPCPSPTPRVYSNSCLLSRWCYPTISSSVVPFPPAFNLSHHQGLFKWVSFSHQVAKVLEFQSWMSIGRTDVEAETPILFLCGLPQIVEKS